MRSLVLLLVALAVAGAASARTESGEGVVSAGSFHEINVVVEVPTSLGWSWRTAPAEAQVAFDVHRHEADGSFTKVREATGVAHASSVQVGPGLYSYYWGHVEGGPSFARVTYTLEGQFRFEHEPAGTGRDAPVEPPKESPLPALLALVGLAAAAGARR